MDYVRVPERWIFFVGNTIVKVTPEDKEIVIVDNKVCGSDLYDCIKDLWYESPELINYEFLKI